MNTRLIVSEAAEREIAQALDWYLENAPEHAERFVDDLDETIGHVRDKPRLYRLVYGDVRRAALGRFPYLLWFIHFDEAEVVHVLAFSHQRQDPSATRQRLA